MADFKAFTVRDANGSAKTWSPKAGPGKGKQFRDHYVRVEQELPKDAVGFTVTKDPDFGGFSAGQTIAVAWKTDEDGIQGWTDNDGGLWLKAQDKTFDWKKATGGAKQETIPGYTPPRSPTNGSGRTQAPQPDDQPPVSGKSVLARIVALKAYAAKAEMDAYQAVGFSREEALALTIPSHGPTGTSTQMRMEQDSNVVWDFHAVASPDPSPPEPIANGADEDSVPF